MGLCQSLEHDGDHREFDEADGGHGQSLVVGHEPPIAAQPREGALNDPTPADDLEAAVLVGSLDDLQGNGQPDDCTRELRPGIAAVGEYLAQPWELPQGLVNQTGSAIAILDVGRDHLDREEMAFGVDDRVALDALGFLARVVADRIDGGPPFSVAFATCVSMIAAVGSASRPQASRQLSSSA
jgi:hypothetical protein